VNGLIALVGSGEYLPVMDETDRHLLAKTVPDGRVARVVCLPTAAGMEGEATISKWMRMGQEHFKRLGAQVDSLHLTNRSEADDPAYAALIEQADMIYFSGGNPVYLYDTLQESKAWQAVLSATGRGAAFAGCSAGAMFIGEYLPDMRAFTLRNTRAFALLPNSHIFPHFDRMAGWAGISLPLIQRLIHDGEYALGVDEDTALVGRLGEPWQVMGRQSVRLITKTQIDTFTAGDELTLPA
jgi:cyanophycinase-like exopeptidase